MTEEPLRITELRTDALIPYARNSRTHSKEQIQQIANSIEEFGFVNPVLIDEKCSIIAGHGRVLAALLLERRTVPTIILEGLTEAQRRAYVIADNKIALNAGWDEVMLGEELKLLQLESVPLEIIGFSTDDLSEYLHTGDDDPSANDKGLGRSEYRNSNLRPMMTIKVHFRNEDEVAAFAKLLDQKVTLRTRFMWFTKDVIDDDDLKPF